MDNVFVIGGDLEGAQRIDKIDREIAGCTVVVIESEDMNTYQLVLRAIIFKNRVIVIVDDTSSVSSKSIAAMMACNEQYDIYGKDEIIGQKPQWLIDNVNSLEDIRTFIGDTFTNLTDISDMLREVEDSLSNISEIRGKNNQILSVVAYILEYMWGELNNYEQDCVKLADELVEIEELRGKITELSVAITSKDSEISSAKTELDRLNEYINSKEKELEDKDKELAEIKNNVASEKKDDKDEKEVSRLKEEINKEKRKVYELEAQLNSGESIIKTYSAVTTQTLKVCKPKSIIYFKEISSVRYCKSMINIMLNVIRKSKKLRCKLLIYGDRHSFMEVYKPLTVVDSTKYLNDRETVVNQVDDLVIVEPNRAIIEDILAANYDVVIIYDTLRHINDIVIGNNVHKFWVINSRKDIEAMQRKLSNFRVADVITREGGINGAIKIRTIGTKNGDPSEYRDMTLSSKSQAYYSMKTSKEAGTKGLIEELLTRTHVADLVTSVR